MLTMYDHIKRKTACHVIEQTNGGVRLALASVTNTASSPTLMLEPSLVRAPTATALSAAECGEQTAQETSARQRHTLTTTLACRTTTQRKGKREEKQVGNSHADFEDGCGSNRATGSEDEQPGASQPRIKSQSARLSTATRQSLNKRRSTATGNNKRHRRGVDNDGDTTADSRGTSLRSKSTAASRDSAKYQRVKATLAANSRTATVNSDGESSSAAIPPPCSSSPPHFLTSQQRVLFQLSSPDKLYLSPVLASGPLSGASTASLFPFTGSFSADLSAASKPSFVHYLVASAEKTLHRVRYILRRDSTHQRHLARCLNISPATLSPMLRGVYDHLKTKHLSMMRTWAAQVDVRYVQHIVSAMRVWRMDETDCSRECGLTLADIKRWLLFDMPLEERSEADRAIARWMRECEQAADQLVNETVARQFEEDYVAAVRDGRLDKWEPDATVKTIELNSVQRDLDATAAKLEEDDKKEADTRAFVVPELTSTDTTQRGLKTSRKGQVKKPNEEAESWAEETSSEHEVLQGGKVAKGAQNEDESSEAASGVAIRIRKKRKSSNQQQPRCEVEKTAKLDVDSSTRPASPASSWHARPVITGPDVVAPWTPLSVLSSVTRLDGGSKPSTFFFFDPNADMAQVADRWSLPAFPVLPSFSSRLPATAELPVASNCGTSTSATIVVTAAKAAVATVLSARPASGSPNSRRESSGSDSSPFTPAVFWAVRTPSSSSLPPFHPPAVFVTPAARAPSAELTLPVFDDRVSAVSGGSANNSSLSSLSMQSLNSLLPTPANATGSSTDSFASAHSAVGSVYGRRSGTDKDELPLARQLILSDEDDTAKPQQQPDAQTPHSQQQQQHYATQQLEFTHAILSMSAGSPLVPGERSADAQ